MQTQNDCVTMGGASVFSHDIPCAACVDCCGVRRSLPRSKCSGGFRRARGLLSLSGPGSLTDHRLPGSDDPTEGG